MIVRISDDELARRLRVRAAMENVYPAAIVCEALRAHLRRLDDVNGAYAEQMDEP